MKISVVVPTLNEEKSINDCLNQFSQFTGFESEVIVCDGGSTDNTSKIVQKHSDVALCISEPGRGQQMNTGAKQATGDVLVFVHADTFLPTNAFCAIQDLLKDQSIIAGFFTNKMYGYENESIMFKFLARFLTLRTLLTKRPLGDACIFVRRAVFKEMGGYKDIPIMEDYEFSGRLKKWGYVARLPYVVRTSVRRFRGGLIRTTLLMFFMKIGFSLGISPHYLYRFYKNIR